MIINLGIFEGTYENNWRLRTYHVTPKVFFKTPLFSLKQTIIISNF